MNDGKMINVIDNSDKTHGKFVYLNYDLVRLNYDTEVFPAMRKLGDMGFKLWIYLYCKRDEDTFIYNIEDYCEKMGVSKEGHKEGEKELLDKGYLVKEKNCFSFYAVSQENKK